MKHWLVTGGVGFIGYHLSHALLLRGDSLRIVDDFSNAPYPEAEKRRNAADLTSTFGERVRIVESSVTFAEKMRSAVQGVDGVIHLAGLAGVRPSFHSPANYAEVNVQGTATLIKASEESGISNFVFASSSSVYGNSTPLPAHEDSAAIAPESPYAASKRGAELFARSLTHHAPKFKCTALRFFTVYGARQRPEMAITLFARRILAGLPISVFGDGSMKRDFTHVSDIVRGIIAAADSPRTGYREYNLGSGHPVDLTSLVRAIGVAANREPIVQPSPVPIGDVDATFADVSRARDELGWSPKVALADGLKTVIDWVERHPT